MKEIIALLGRLLRMKMMFVCLTENRLCYLKIGENYKAYGQNIGSYFKEGWNEKDPIKLAVAPFMATGSLLGEGLEPLASGMINQKLERPIGIMARTRRDLKALGSDIFHIRPLAAVRDAWSLLTSDVPLDFGEAIVGYHQKNTRSTIQAMQK